jgi:molecular chaperone DnaJ
MNRELYNRLELTEEDIKLPFNQFKDVVKKNYRKLALQYHPDKQVGKSEEEVKSAEEQFKKISEAYETLSDEQKKQQYDMFGTTSGNFNANNFRGFSAFNDDDMMNEIFERFMGFGRRRGGNEKVYQGKDVHLKIELSIDDILHGVVKKYKYKKEKQCPQCNGGEFVSCPHCGGTGMITKATQHFGMFMQQSSPCPYCQGQGSYVKNTCNHCQGHGLVNDDVIVEVNIPKGCTEGTVLTLSGYGNELPKPVKGNSGNLQVIIANIKLNDDNYRIEGYHLIKFQDVNILDIITGSKINITTPLKETIAINIPKGIGDKKQLRVSGKGLPDRYNNRGRGDLFVVIQHKYPNSLTSKEIKLIDELKKSTNFK